MILWNLSYSKFSSGFNFLWVDYITWRWSEHWHDSKARIIQITSLVALIC